jgi:hypothetical protein
MFQTLSDFCVLRWFVDLAKKRSGPHRKVPFSDKALMLTSSK